VSTIVIALAPDTHRALEDQANRVGKSPEELSRELIERGLQAIDTPPIPTARDVLTRAQRVSTLSESMRRRIIPDISLDDIRAALSKASGPPLSEIIIEQRGGK
jgi:hypothetical protein